MPKCVHLPFLSPFSMIYFATSGAAVISIPSIPLAKAVVPRVSCNSPVHHPSPDSSGTARAKLPVKQTALKRDGPSESSHAGIAIPACQGVGLTAGSGPCGKGEANHTPSSKMDQSKLLQQETAFCTSLHQAGLPAVSNTACHVYIDAGWQHRS